MKFPTRGSSYHHITRLRHSRVLVIGGTSGIGLSIAAAAIEYGASLTISGSSEAKLQAAVEHLQGFESPFHQDVPEVCGYLCDLHDIAAQEHNLTVLLEAATKQGAEPLDHIIFTAGNEIAITSCEQVTPAQVYAMQAVRVMAPIMLGKLAPRYMSNTSNSSVTLTGGTKALKPSAGWSVLAGVISSITGLTKGLAVDLQPIRVNAVFPGAVRSTAASAIDLPQLEEQITRYRATTLTNTVGSPQEVAEAYIYCMKSTYTTGTILVVDGGKMLK